MLYWMYFPLARCIHLYGSQVHVQGHEGDTLVGLSKDVLEVLVVCVSSSGLAVGGLGVSAKWRSRCCPASPVQLRMSGCSTSCMDSRRYVDHGAM